MRIHETKKASPWQLGALASFSLMTVLAFSGCDAVQPKTQCKVRGQTYAAKYILKEMTGMCTDKILTGEVLNLGYYRDAKDYAEGAPSVAIMPATVVEAVGDVMKTEPGTYAIGKFKSAVPNDSDVCTAAELSENKVTTPMGDLSYNWKNFQIIVRPDSNAFHFGADLVRQDGDCKATYKVTASAPVVFCGDGMKAKVDEMGKPVVDAQGNPEMEPDPTTGKPNPEACNTDPVTGSLSPQLVWECDATADGKGSHLCVPKNEFPSLAKSK